MPRGTGRSPVRINVHISIRAYTVPAILIVCGFILMILGGYSPDTPFWGAGVGLVLLGVIVFLLMAVFNMVSR